MSLHLCGSCESHAIVLFMSPAKGVHNDAFDWLPWRLYYNHRDDTEVLPSTNYGVSTKCSYICMNQRSQVIPLHPYIYLLCRVIGQKFVLLSHGRVASILIRHGSELPVWWTRGMNPGRQGKRQDFKPLHQRRQQIGELKS